MKNVILSVAVLITVACVPSYTYAQSKLNPGDDLPSKEVSLKNANGQPVTMASSMKENGLLVMFSCNTCPFVIKNQPITKKVMDYASAHHIGMIIVNSNEAQRGEEDSYEAMAKYARAHSYTVPYVVDDNSALANLFGASHTPEVYLFDKKGKLVYKGAMNDNPGDPGSYQKMYVEDAMNAMIAGKAVDPQTTKSVGCGIKRKA